MSAGAYICLTPEISGDKFFRDAGGRPPILVDEEVRKDKGKAYDTSSPESEPTKVGENNGGQESKRAHVIASTGNYLRRKDRPPQKGPHQEEIKM